MNDDIQNFKQVVKETLRGGKFKGQAFDKMIK